MIKSVVLVLGLFSSVALAGGEAVQVRDQHQGLIMRIQGLNSIGITVCEKESGKFNLEATDAVGCILFTFDSRESLVHCKVNWLICPYRIV